MLQFENIEDFLYLLSAGIKSSLRRPSGPGSSSSSWPGRKSEERSTNAGKSQDKSPNQETSHSNDSGVKHAISFLLSGHHYGGFYPVQAFWLLDAFFITKAFV